MSPTNDATNRPNIVVTAEDLLTPTDASAEQNIALRVARSLPSDYVDPEVINVMSGIGVSPEYHDMVAKLISGQMILRDFAAYVYMAGRLSIALAKQQ
ncbi:hypothetical protein BH10ACI4_BH10ACI4_35710 [soil metagenome]